MIVREIGEIQSILPLFKNHNCVIIICRYNGGKSSTATELIHQYFGEENTYYVTFIDQSKPHFIPRESKLKFNEMVKGKVIVFDEIDSEEKIDLTDYLKNLIENNLVIILSNPYGSSDDDEKEIKLFREHEKDILPENTLFIFVKEKPKDRKHI